MGDTPAKETERGYLYGGVPSLVRDRRFGSACTPQTLVTRFIFDINHAIIASGFVFNTCSDVESTIIYYKSTDVVDKVWCKFTPHRCPQSSAVNLL